jgi:hypothetical protein
MTYKKIYNQLNKAGLIDKILSETNNDKLGVIKGIQYLEYFLNTSSFKEMKYWTESTADKTACKICVEYAKLQIENKAKHLEPFEYMAKTMIIAK